MTREKMDDYILRLGIENPYPDNQSAAIAVMRATLRAANAVRERSGQAEPRRLPDSVLLAIYELPNQLLIVDVDSLADDNVVAQFEAANREVIQRLLGHITSDAKLSVPEILRAAADWIHFEEHLKYQLTLIVLLTITYADAEEVTTNDLGHQRDTFISEYTAAYEGVTFAFREYLNLAISGEEMAKALVKHYSEPKDLVALHLLCAVMARCLLAGFVHFSDSVLLQCKYGTR